MSDDRDDLISAEEAVEEVLLDDEEIVEEEIEESEQDESGEENESSDEDEEIVERAKKYGHLSKEEWIAAGRNAKDWKSPEEFDKTGKVIEQLYTLKKKVDQRDREIQALIDYQQRTSQREYERAKQELESRLAASKDDMDMEGVSHYTKELTRLEDIENNNKVQTYQAAQKSAQEAFLERNQHWFNDRNPDLMNRAIEIDNEITQLYKNASYEEKAEMIEKRMQYEHPERVLGERGKVKAPVSSSRQSSVNKSAVNKSSVSRTFKSLPQDLKDTYSATKRIVESRGDREYTVNDFINQLKKDGEI